MIFSQWPVENLHPVRMRQSLNHSENLAPKQRQQHFTKTKALNGASACGLAPSSGADQTCKEHWCLPGPRALL